MPETKAKPIDNAVALELDVLQKELCSKEGVRCNDLSDEEAILIFRLLSGVTPDAWGEVADKHGLSHWFTMPLDGDAIPHIKRLQATVDKLTFQTDHDPLTGLANRRAFDRALETELERTRRNKTPLSLAVFDLDFFKKVNDTHGHNKGDEVLVEFARHLSRTTRRYDLPARLGGEEFAVIMAGTSLIKAKRMFARLRSEFKDVFFTGANGEDFNVTFSAGLTNYKGTVPMVPKQFVELADKALYAAKDAGRDRLEVSPLPDIDLVPKETLVKSNEKQFLFGK